MSNNSNITVTHEPPDAMPFLQKALDATPPPRGRTGTRTDDVGDGSHVLKAHMRLHMVRTVPESMTLSRQRAPRTPLGSNQRLSLIHISEPTRRTPISYA